MELEDILYIVIFAVVILSGFFRKKPKPKQPQYEPSEIEQMLATLSGRQTQGDDLYDDIPEFQEQPAPASEKPS